MENFELTGSRLNRLYSVQVQIQFNSTHNSIQPRPRQGQSEQGKIKSIQSSSQFKSMCIWPQVYPTSSKLNSNLFNWQFNSMWNRPRVSPARSNFRSNLFTVHLSMDVAKGHSDEAKIQFSVVQESWTRTKVKPSMSTFNSILLNSQFKATWTSLPRLLKKIQMWYTTSDPRRAHQRKQRKAGKKAQRSTRAALLAQPTIASFSWLLLDFSWLARRTRSPSQP